MLELLAASARARIVAADFRTGANRTRLLDRGGGFADDIAALAGGVAAGTGFRCGRTVATESAGRLTHRSLRSVAQEVLERHQAGGATENVVADLGFDVDHQFLENLEGFGL